MNLIPLPAFSDNYVWWLQRGDQVLVVDPGDAAPVLARLQAHPTLRLTAVLVTHHHADHTGGVAALQQACPGVQVWAPLMEPLKGPHTPVHEGDVLDWADGTLTVLDVPGHTAGHVAYLWQAGADDPALFCGDTLFVGGCGRLFEGTAGQMLASLDRLAALPDNTLVCCAHEYTLSNLRFASHVDPENLDLQRHVAQCEHLRAEQRPTVPGRMGTERLANPFLRSRAPAIRQALHTRPEASGLRTDADHWGALRAWKNDFR